MAKTKPKKTRARVGRHLRSLPIPPRLLVSGVPGAGKSYFLKWLSREQGYRTLHVDDSADVPSVNSILSPAMRARIAEAKAAARRLGEKIAIEYGFPPDSARDHVEALRAAGFDAWWFHSDNYTEAFRAYIKGKENVPGAAEDFHSQVDKIIAHWPSLQRLFKARMIMSLNGSVHLKPEVIWGLILRAQRKAPRKTP